MQGRIEFQDVDGEGKSQGLKISGSAKEKAPQPCLDLQYGNYG